MKKLSLALTCVVLSLPVIAKDSLKVEVVAAHQVTHESQDNRSVLQAGILGSHAPRADSESFNLDAVINGEHVVLLCDDPKACEEVPAGTYPGEMKRNKWIRLSFTLPVTHKSVARWYKIGGSW